MSLRAEFTADWLIADDTANAEVLWHLGDSCALLVGFGLGFVVDRCVPQERRRLNVRR
jgi:hypothetical protein